MPTLNRPQLGIVFYDPADPQTGFAAFDLLYEAPNPTSEPHC
jgi:hypothetical protein